jgi:hypothetical protein
MDKHTLPQRPEITITLHESGDVVLTSDDNGNTATVAFPADDIPAVIEILKKLHNRKSP